MHRPQQADFAPGSIFLVRPRQLHHEVSQGGYGNDFLFFKNCFLSREQSFYQIQDAANSPIRTLIGLLHSEFLEGHPFGEGVYVEQLRREIETHFRDPDYSYFSRQFKQQTGFPPREWAHISPYTTHVADSEL